MQLLLLLLLLLLLTAVFVNESPTTTYFPSTFWSQYRPNALLCLKDSETAATGIMTMRECSDDGVSATC
jgi:hypothetical protein